MPATEKSLTATIGPMHREIMTELRAIRAKMATLTAAAHTAENKRRYGDRAR